LSALIHSSSHDCSVFIRSIGVYKPHKKLTNNDLKKLVDTSDEWIVSRTGIKERRVADRAELTSHMGTKAALQALERAKLSPKDIDLLIVATLTPDMPFPATACFIQHQLGLRTIPAFDIQAACSGFLYGIEVASKMLLSGDYQNALVIGAEKISSILDWEDRSTCILFGDGAGAAVLSKAPQKNQGIIGSILGADGAYAEILHLPAGGTACPPSIESLNKRLHFLKMNGKEVFKKAVNCTYQVSAELLEKYNIHPSQVTHVVPHQANIRIIEVISKRLQIPMNRFLTNLESMGNTSAASIPIALADALEEGKLKNGDLLLLIAFGAGLTWAATLLKWHSI